MYVAVAIETGEHARHHSPVFQHIADPTGRLGAIRQYAHGAVPAPNHIHGVQNQLVLSRHLDALAGAQETAVAEHGFWRQQAVAQQCSGAIQIAQQQVEQLRAFQQARLDPRPVLAADNVGYRIHFPATAGTAFTAVDIKGGTIVAQDTARFLLAFAQRIGTQVAQAAQHVLPLGFDGALWRAGVVEQPAAAFVFQWQ